MEQSVSKTGTLITTKQGVLYPDRPHRLLDRKPPERDDDDAH